jgi:hypothetical protein
MVNRSIQYNPKYLTVQPQVQLPFSNIPIDGFTLQLKQDYSRKEIQPEELVHFAYPIVQFIHEVKPDAVFALDRGARPLGLAVKMLWRKLYPDEQFPTQDRSIKFRKISRKVKDDVDRERIQQDVMHLLDSTEQPTVLVLDDWISTGGTQEVVKQLFDEFSDKKIRILFGVMRGNGGDISGDSNSRQLGVWHDKPELTGVDYEGRPLKPYVVKDPQAREFRLKIIKGIDAFVSTLDIRRQIFTSE